MNIALWIVQIILALLFLFAGGTKLILSMEQMAKMAPPDAIQFPGLFVRFIGVCEVLGALGLVLPGLLRRNQQLTPLAAFLLLIIMIGAVVASVMGPGAAAAVPALVIGILCAFVAYGRWHLRPPN